MRTERLPDEPAVSSRMALGRLVVSAWFHDARWRLVESASDYGFRVPRMKRSFAVSYVEQSRLNTWRRDDRLPTPPVADVATMLQMLRPDGPDAHDGAETGGLVRCDLGSRLTSPPEPRGSNLRNGGRRINVPLLDESGDIPAELRQAQLLAFPEDVAERRAAGRTDGRAIDLTLAVVEPVGPDADLDGLLAADIRLPRYVMLTPLSLVDMRLVQLGEAS